MNIRKQRKGKEQHDDSGDYKDGDNVKRMRRRNREK